MSKTLETAGIGAAGTGTQERIPSAGAALWGSENALEGQNTGGTDPSGAAAAQTASTRTFNSASSNSREAR